MGFADIFQRLKHVICQALKMIVKPMGGKVIDSTGFSRYNDLMGDKFMGITKDETGKKYGRLTVIGRDRQNKKREAYWICLCDCGNKKSVSGHNLRGGRQISCGCYKRELLRAKAKNLIGNKYGRLTVVSRHKTPIDVYWLCLCDCGKEKIVLAEHLNNGHVQSCGCLRQEFYNSIRKPFGEAALGITYKSKQRDAIKRGIDFLISIEQFAILSKEPCYYCGVSPYQKLHHKDLNGEYFYNGLDRINSDYGYTVNNIVPCCGNCNKAKGTMNYNDFISWIKRIYKNHKKR